MPAPASTISVSSIPFSRVVTQAEFNAGTYGNAANEVWFQYVASEPIVLGMQSTSGGTFTPRTTVYESDGSTTVDPARNGAFGMWSALDAAGTYYVKVTRQGGGASDFDFTFNADTLPLDDVTLIEEGDFMVNDDQNRPGTLISATGEVKGFLSGLPGGEMGAILPSGVSLWHDRYGIYGSDKLALLDADLNYIIGANAGVTGVNFPIMTADDTQFYVVNQAGDLWIVEEDGTETNTGYFISLSYDLPEAMGIDAAGTTIYWAEIDDSGIIRTIDVGSLTDGANLYTIPGFVINTDKIARTGNGHPGELLVLEDGSIVTWWYDASATTYHLIHIDSGGTLLHDISYASPISIDHIQRIEGSVDAIRIWLFTGSSITEGHFGTLTFASGLITDDFTVPLFDSGLNRLDSEMFGISNSCTMIFFPSAITRLIVSEVCCPCDCPTPVGPRGSPSTAPLPSHVGVILRPVDPLAWIPACVGGGVVPTASDATDPESWVM